MLYEYKDKVYIKVGNKYIQVDVTQKENGEYDVKVIGNREYVEKMPNVATISLESAYKLCSKNLNTPSEKPNEKPKRSNILDN